MSAFVSDGVTIAALFTLDEDRSLEFGGRAFLDEFRFHWSAAPGLHMRRPWPGNSCVGQHPNDQVSQQDDDDRHRSPAVMLFSLVGKKRQSKQKDHGNRRHHKEQNDL